MSPDNARESRLVFRLVLFVAVAVVGVAALASVARAMTYCVHTDKPCTLLGSNQPTIQAALDLAAMNGTEDTVLVGDNDHAPYLESPSYFSAEVVHVVGDGIGETVVKGVAPALITFTLRSPGSSIEAMTIEGRDTNGGASLDWDGEARAIEAIGNGSPSTETRGVVPVGGATMSDSRIEYDGFKGMIPIGSTGAIISDTSIAASGVGVDVGAGEHLALRGVTVTSGRGNVQVAGANSSAVLENVVLHRTGTVFGDGGIYALSGAAVSGRHLTIVGSGGGSGVYLNASAAATSVTLVDSILVGGQFALRCFGENGFSSTLSVSYTNWTEARATSAADGCAYSEGAGNQVVAVDFSSGLLPDYHLAAPSPLIDAGEPGGPGGTDRDGLLRKVDGDGDGSAISDLGAFEYQRRAPQAVLNAPAGANVGEPVTFTAAGSGDPDPRDTLTYAWSFGDGGDATGFEAAHAYTTPGVHTVNLTVTDQVGLQATATAQIAVTAAAPVGAGPAAGGAAPAPAKARPLRCGKGKRKKVVRGKARCIKRKHHGRRSRGSRS